MKLGFVCPARDRHASRTQQDPLSNTSGPRPPVRPRSCCDAGRRPRGEPLRAGAQHQAGISSGFRCSRRVQMLTWITPVIHHLGLQRTGHACARSGSDCKGHISPGHSTRLPALRHHAPPSAPASPPPAGWRSSHTLPHGTRVRVQSAFTTPPGIVARPLGSGPPAPAQALPKWRCHGAGSMHPWADAVAALFTTVSPTRTLARLSDNNPAASPRTQFLGADYGYELAVGVGLSTAALVLLQLQPRRRHPSPAREWPVSSASATASAFAVRRSPPSFCMANVGDDVRGVVAGVAARALEISERQPRRERARSAIAISVLVLGSSTASSACSSSRPRSAGWCAAACRPTVGSWRRRARRALRRR